MIISRTPFRISFSGGGSDLPSYYEKNGGAVISTTINKYMYMEIHPYFASDRIQLKYSKTENVSQPKEIEHRIFRRVLEKYNISGVEITSTADLPAGTGMGSSSSFTVGLLQCVHAFSGRFRSREEIAEEACQIEISDLGNPIGKQDQYAAALGGLNYIKFHRDGSVRAFPILIERQKYLQFIQNFMLFYTGAQRDTNEVLAEQIENIEKQKEKVSNLDQMVEIAGEMRAVLERGDIDSFGHLLDETWRLKKTLASSISSSHLDEFYQMGIDCGAAGGKLLGAGGGGFFLFYCKPEYQARLRQGMASLTETKFGFENEGLNVIYYQV